MPYYNTNELKSGIRVLINGEPHNVLENEYMKPGKGQAINRLKLRHLKSGRVLERTLRSADRLEAADVVEIEVDYLYQQANVWHFMSPSTYDQYTVPNETVGDTKYWLIPQTRCDLILFNNQPMQVVPPNFVILEVTDTDPGLKGDTSGGGNKPATLQTDVAVKVPLFVQIGDKIKVDTRTRAYLERIKE